jgi:GNAT superfamily N-acetyltransferase
MNAQDKLAIDLVLIILMFVGGDAWLRHINLDERNRNRGIGSALIAAFAAQAGSAVRAFKSSPESGARNIRFIRRILRSVKD